MFQVESHFVAILFCVVTMLCWGSWANTQKKVSWRFEYFYWDYVVGIVAMSLLMALTFGNTGDPANYGFWQNLGQATVPNVLLAFIGGVIFNAANILLVAAIAIAGLSVAFPVGIGLALVLGVFVNYMANQQGNGWLLFFGVLFVTAAIVLNAIAYRNRTDAQAAGDSVDQARSTMKKGLCVSVAAGVLMAFFYYFVAASMPSSFVELKEFGGKLSPYTATFVFALGVLASNCWFNPYIMRRPFQGEPVDPAKYWDGTAKDHMWGILGGAIWCIGTSLNIIASTVASPAIAYGLGQGATLVTALWGVFVWKEFKDCDKKTDRILLAMFGTFILGLALIMAAKSGDNTSAVAAAPVASDASAEMSGSQEMRGGPWMQGGPGMGKPGMGGGPWMNNGPNPWMNNGGPEMGGAPGMDRRGMGGRPGMRERDPGAPMPVGEGEPRDGGDPSESQFAPPAPPEESVASPEPAPANPPAVPPASEEPKPLQVISDGVPSPAPEEPKTESNSSDVDKQ